MYGAKMFYFFEFFCSKNTTSVGITGFFEEAVYKILYKEGKWIRNGKLMEN